MKLKDIKDKVIKKKEEVKEEPVVEKTETFDPSLPESKQRHLR